MTAVAAEWTVDELALRDRLAAGETIVVNMRSSGHPRLWAWARQVGLAERIDRKSMFGNPLVIGQDGTRDEVCDRYATVWWPLRPELHVAVARLRGRALGCWCAPRRCHGDFLARVADTTGGAQ